MTSLSLPGGLSSLPPLPECRERGWAQHAIRILAGDGHRSADTHLLKPLFSGLSGI